MQSAGLTPKKIHGRRVTDDATLEIVVHALLNNVNQSIIRQIRDLGGRAVGLHGEPLQCLFGEKLYLEEDGESIDLGHVGSVSGVDGAMIRDFALAGVVPVIPCLAHDEEGNWLNINGDTAAAAVAGHLSAEKLVFLTDTPGILQNQSDPQSLIRHLDGQECHNLIQQGVIAGGMIPKVEACLEALKKGVRKTHMIDGRLMHSLLLEIYTDRGVGTEIVLGFAS